MGPANGLADYLYPIILGDVRNTFDFVRGPYHFLLKGSGVYVRSQSSRIGLEVNPAIKRGQRSHEDSWTNYLPYSAMWRAKYSRLRLGEVSLYLVYSAGATLTRLSPLFGWFCMIIGPGTHSQTTCKFAEYMHDQASLSV